MKRIHCLTLLLTALLLSAFTADAYKVTFRWNLPESAMIKIGGMSSGYSPEELSTGQKEYTYESASSSWLYIIAKEGYRIVSATAPDSSQLEPMFSTTAAADGGSGSYWGKFMTETYLGLRPNRRCGLQFRNRADRTQFILYGECRERRGKHQCLVQRFWLFSAA